MNKNQSIFQIILLEHASKVYWEDPLLENFYLVEEFRDGNALIPAAAQFKIESSETEENHIEDKLDGEDNEETSQGDLFEPSE